MFHLNDIQNMHHTLSHVHDHTHDNREMEGCHTPVVVQHHVDAAAISFASCKYAYACLELPEQAHIPASCSMGPRQQHLSTCPSNMASKPGLLQCGVQHFSGDNC